MCKQKEDLSAEQKKKNENKRQKKHQIRHQA